MILLSAAAGNLEEYFCLASPNRPAQTQKAPLPSRERAHRGHIHRCKAGLSLRSPGSDFLGDGMSCLYLSHTQIISTLQIQPALGITTKVTGQA